MLKIHWFLPTGGDSRNIVATHHADAREPSHAYLADIARAADQLGFAAVLTPCGTGCEDSWITTASLIPLTERLNFLVAMRPGLLSPTLAAQMASTYQRMSGGRLLVNIVTGAEPTELARFGDFADKDTRYERTGEFIDIMKKAWAAVPADVTGTHFTVQGATTRCTPTPAPEIYFGGASAAAEVVAARFADVYLTWGETPEMVGERLERMRQLAATYDRTLRFGIRFHTIARSTSNEAWTEAQRLVDAIPDDAKLAAQRDFAATQSEGQRRMAELAARSELEIYPNVWTGIGQVRGGAGTALVGSHEEVADRIEEYADLGIDEFILSGYPHLEEAWQIGEGVMPLLVQRGRLENRDLTRSTNVFHFR